MSSDKASRPDMGSMSPGKISGVLRDLSRNPENLLFGGIMTEFGLIRQRLSYVFLHAYSVKPEDIEGGFDTLSDATIAERLSSQSKLVRGFLDDFYPDYAHGAMLGSDGEGFSMRYDAARRKPARALSRLKSKKLHAETFLGLQKLMDGHFGVDLLVPYSVFLSLAGGTVWKHADFRISDDVWYSAIELVMIMRHRDVYFDYDNEEQWIRYLEGDILLLWTLVYYIASIGYYSMYCLEHKDMLRQLAHYEDNMEALTQDMQHMGSAFASYKRERDAEARAMAAAADSKSKDYSELCDENKRLSARIASLEKELAALKGREGRARQAREPVPDEAPSANGAAFQEDAAPDCLAELPDKNVLFVGGHPNMLSKLIPMFPGWRFVSAEVSPGAVPDKMQPTFVFTWSNHLKHSLFERVRQLYGDRPSAYCKATNVEMLVREMREAYTAYRNSIGNRED